MEHEECKLNKVPEKNKITTKIKHQESIEDVYNCLTRNILHAVENTVSKTTLETKKIPPVAW